MGRILAIDYGKKRVGIAVTDPMQIICTALNTVSATSILNYLEIYFEKESVSEIVLGLPVNLKSQDTDGTPLVRLFAEKLKEKFPTKPIVFYDERFTSKMAMRVMIDSGMKKKDRRIKGNIDQISAVLILQSYMSSKNKGL